MLTEKQTVSSSPASSLATQPVFMPTPPMPLSPQQLWERIVAKLPHRDPDAEWYSPDELAPLLGIQRKALYPHLRDLWPKHEGEWRMSREEAERLIKRVCRAGKKVKNTFVSSGTFPTA